jgi:predicted membrane protein
MPSENQGRMLSGILIILVGLVFLLGSLGKLDIGDFFSTYWPLFLIFLGIWHLVQQNFRNNGFGLLLILIGAFFMLVNWNVLGFNLWKIFWPLLIVGIGLWVIFKPKGFKGNVPKITDDDLGAFTVFSGIKRQVESKEFKGGKATVLFGSIELDFYKARLAENQATVELTALFGSIEIYVPEDWKVILDSSAIFGGVDDKRRKITPEKPEETLYVRATAVFGSIEIKN